MWKIVFRKDRIYLIALLFILLSAAFLRFFGLANQSLWNDELSSWWRSNYEQLSVVIEKGVKPDVHPPGFHILLYFVERHIGDTESILRFPSALAGLLSVLIIFLIGMQLYSKKEGLMASLFMAVLWCPIYFSQETRSYSLLLLFSLLASYFLIRLIKYLREEKFRAWHVTVGYIVASVITAYLHYFGLYFIALQGLLVFLLLVKNRKALVYIVGVYIVILLAYAPWIPTMISQFSGEGGNWISKPGPEAYLGCLKYFFNESNLLVHLVLSFYAFLMIISLYDFARSSSKRMWLMSSSGIILTLWLLVPFTIIFILSITIKPILTYRNLIISLPAAYLLLARAITRLPVNVVKQSLITVIISGLFLYNLFVEREYYSKPHKQQFRDAVKVVVDQDAKYKNSIIIGYAWNSTYLNYYFEKLGSKRRLNFAAGQKGHLGYTKTRISKRKPAYIWYVSGHRIPEPEYLDYLKQDNTMLLHKPFIGANVWLFQSQ